MVPTGYEREIARRVHTADLAGQPLQALLATPPSLALQD